MEEKQRGGGGREGDAPAVGEQDNRTASHMWAGGGRVRGLWGLHTVALLQGGGWGWRWGDAADKVWRNGSFPPILPLGSLDTEHSC